MEAKTYPKVTIVDDNDNVLAYMSLLDAISQNLRQRVVCTFVLNEAGDILLQRRSAHVLESNKWDFASAGHVDEGESYTEAAHRELYEELRFDSPELALVVPPFATTERFNAVYKVTVPTDFTITPNEEEVAAVQFFSRQELQERIKTDPNMFTLTFLEVWERVHDKIEP